MIKNRFIKIISENFILILILLFAIILRFYHINDWLFFGMDQEYEAFIAKNIISFRHFPAIGVNASDTGIYLGPAFIYFAAVPFALFQGNPLGWSITASLLGIASTYAVYLLGKIWWGKTHGYLAAFFYGSSFLATVYDRQFWNPTTIPLLTVLIFYSITKAIKENRKYLIISAILLGLALQSHLQAILIGIVITGILLKYRQRLSKKNIIGFVCIIIAFQIPIIFFDIRHNFTNAKALTNLVASPLKTNSEIILTPFTDRISLFTSVIGRALYIAPGVDLFTENGQCSGLSPLRGSTNILAILISLLSVILFFTIYSKKKNRSIEFYVITGTIIITLLGLILYNRRIYEYYFLYLIPVFYLLFAYSIYTLFRNNKYIILVVISMFLIINMKTLLTSDMTYSYKDKIEAIKFTQKYVENENYNLNAIGDCGKYGGYRYLFEYSGYKPGSSYMDVHFSWLYKEPVKDPLTKTVTLIFIDSREGSSSVEKINQEERKLQTQQVIAASQFGKIRVYITENAKTQPTSTQH